MLSSYIDEQLHLADRKRVESHLEGCQACCVELESLKATLKLLHRVALVTPPRSFAIAEAAPIPRPATARAFGALRVATAAAALLLVFTFAGDAAHLFEAGPVEERTAQQVTPMANEDEGAIGLSLDGEGYANSEGYTWPVREIELALSGVVVALGGATALLWQRRRRGEKALKG